MRQEHQEAGDRLPAPPKTSHVHAGCRHRDFCYSVEASDCRECRTEKYNRSVRSIVA